MRDAEEAIISWPQTAGYAWRPFVFRDVRPPTVTLTTGVTTTPDPIAAWRGLPSGEGRPQRLDRRRRAGLSQRACAIRS